MEAKWESDEEHAPEPSSHHEHGDERAPKRAELLLADMRQHQMHHVLREEEPAKPDEHTRVLLHIWKRNRSREGLRIKVY
jgi:hypothetical protein